MTQRYSIVKLSESQMTRITQMTRILRYSLPEIDLGSRQFSRELNVSGKLSKQRHRNQADRAYTRVALPVF